MVNFFANICLTSTSEILIIRHGRSRKRHSTEKDRVKWGLRALDNLTIIDALEALDGSETNDTNAVELNLNIVNFFENNVTDVSMQFNQSNEFSGMIGAYEIDYSSGNFHSTPKNNITNNKKHRFDNFYTTTVSPYSFTQAPLSYFKHGKHGKKKAIMENIRNTVNKGIEYLKTHKNLDEIKIEVNELGSSNRKARIKNAHNTALSEDIVQNDEPPNINTPTKVVATSSTTVPSTIKSKEKPFNNLKSSDYDDSKSFPSTVAPLMGLTNEKIPKKSKKDNGQKQQMRLSNKKSEFDDDEINGTQDKTVLNFSPTNFYNDSEESSNFDNAKTNIDNHNQDHLSDSSLDDEASSSNADFINSLHEDDLDDNEFNNENSALNGIYQVEDLDLSNMDETSRNNRKNLMRGKDVVTKFLQIVESQHGTGTNCTAGTAHNLGEGVVDRYAQDRFRIEAEVAVNRANMLTR